ncbi:MAG: hypothetical protein V1735_06560 [Nanoarchaeota archaeon]
MVGDLDIGTLVTWEQGQHPAYGIVQRVGLGCVAVYFAVDGEAIESQNVNPALLKPTNRESLNDAIAAITGSDTILEENLLALRDFYDYTSAVIDLERERSRQALDALTEYVRNLTREGSQAVSDLEIK